MPGLFWGALNRGVAYGYLCREMEDQATVAELLTLRPDFPTVARQLTGMFVLEISLSM